MIILLLDGKTVAAVVDDIVALQLTADTIVAAVDDNIADLGGSAEGYVALDMDVVVVYFDALIARISDEVW